mgnify:CR=1 FL=1
MQLEAIKYVLRVAETGSFSKAAELLFISQPAISQSVKRLENELGVDLFRRESNSVTLTSAGKLFVEDGKAMVELSKRMKKRIFDVQNLKYGNISIGVSPFYEKFYLSKILPEFHKEYPGVDIEIVENYTGVLEDLVLRRKIDLCITPLPLTIQSLNYEPLFEESILLAVPIQHPLNSKICPDSGEERLVADLSLFKDEEFIMYRQGRRMRAMCMDLCKQAGFIPNIIFEANNSEILNALVAGGMGVGFVPMGIEICCPPEQRAAYYFLQSQNATRTFTIVYNDDAHHSTIVDEFIRIAHSLSSNMNNGKQKK